MSKEVKCVGCNKSLGMIEKGRISMGIKFLCSSCDEKRRAAIMAIETSRGDMPDFFKQIFGGKI